MEFDLGTEILHNGKFKDFNYYVVAGKYPTLGQNEDPYQIAISTYLADSIIHYLNGNELSNKKLTSYEDFLDVKITINSQKTLI